MPGSQVEIVAQGSKDWEEQTASIRNDQSLCEVGVTKNTSDGHECPQVWYIIVWNKKNCVQGR